jgi:hypothetical protein
LTNFPAVIKACGMKVRWAAVLVAFAGIHVSQGQNLIENGEFVAAQGNTSQFLAGQVLADGCTSAPGIHGETSGGAYGAVSIFDGGAPNSSYLNLGTYAGMNGVSQTFGTAPNSLYHVSFGLYPNWFNPPYNGVLRVSVGDQSLEFAAVGSGAPEQPAPIPFVTHEFDFRSDGSGSSTLLFQNVTWMVYVDHVSVTAVPEPGTFALLGLGVPVVLLYRRRKQK